MIANGMAFAMLFVRACFPQTMDMVTEDQEAEARIFHLVVACLKRRFEVNAQFVKSVNASC